MIIDIVANLIALGVGVGYCLFILIFWNFFAKFSGINKKVKINLGSVLGLSAIILTVLMAVRSMGCLFE
ncbi:hypothetical protein [Escherichia albertii]|uniref:hypothetical protein n=1 Tax=Escherichia albertii TaxID=208962 RepID=UPI001831D8F7|nr:hypothetical protein [Escherichia albertii]MCI5275811.1 hypothetical protein [Escherichia albertii]MCZ8661457.1 hypothetical protein [Escherichia albertii]MCZ9009735.1 hypothetical protein [Escherichia albertii]HCZ5333285.1 hypothetical protein [Escherichia albertii]